MKISQTDDRTFNRLVAYFDRRFDALEKELAQHSSVMTSICVDVHKILAAQSKAPPKNTPDPPHKELTLNKSFNNPVKAAQGNKNEQKCVVRLQLSDNKQKQNNKENVVAGLGERVSSKQSPRLVKPAGKKESKRTRNTKLEVFKTTEECSINSVFSPNSHTGETKELIIEPIEVVFQESPGPQLEGAVKQYTSLSFRSMPGSIRPSPLPTPKCKLKLLPGNCLYLLDQFLGKALPDFAITCKTILEKYIKYGIKEIHTCMSTMKRVALSLTVGFATEVFAFGSDEEDVREFAEERLGNAEQLGIVAQKPVHSQAVLRAHGTQVPRLLQ